MQSDESEKRKMDSTKKNLYKNLTLRSEETLGAGAIFEEDTSDKFVQEEMTFVKVSSTHHQELIDQVTHQNQCFNLRTTKDGRTQKRRQIFLTSTPEDSYTRQHLQVLLVCQV